MPVIQRNVDILSGASNDNILSGSTFEFPERNSIISIGAVSAVADVFMSIIIGATTVLEESEMVVRTTFPVIPDEMYYQDVASAGQRIVIRVRNANAATTTVRAIVQSVPV